MKAVTAGTDLFSRYKYPIWFVLVAVHCCITFYNGYPVLYSDTSTYLSSGFELQAPADRPITYGILLTIFSFGGLSLYLVPAFQTIIYLYALKKICELFFEREAVLKSVSFLSLLIFLFTGFSWSLNLLLPDFFTPVGFICLYCLLAGSKKLKQEWLLVLVFFIAAASHISNIFSFIIIIFLAAVTQSIFFKHVEKKAFRIKLAVTTLLLVISYIIAGSAISKSKHVFMMGNLAQKGILQQVLNDSCGHSTFALCAYKDSIPKSFEYFVWNQKSPLYKMGGWKTTKAEYKKIIGISFSQPKYLGMHVSRSAENFVSQLGTFGIGEGTGAFKEETVLIQRIRRFIRLDSKQCINTKQYSSAFISMDRINTFYRACLASIFILFIWLLFSRYRQFNNKTRLLVFFTTALILSTSALVAFTAEVSNRYGCRIAWLLLLLSFFMISPAAVKKPGSN